MPINCGYCGRTHPTAKEVKDCWEDHGRPKSNRSGRRKGGPTRTVPPPAASAPADPRSPLSGGVRQPAKPNRKVKPRPGRGSAKPKKRLAAPGSAVTTPVFPGSAVTTSVPFVPRSPKKSKLQKCSACGMAISIDGKCRCS